MDSRVWAKNRRKLLCLVSKGPMLDGPSLSAGGGFLGHSEYYHLLNSKEHSGTNWKVLLGQDYKEFIQLFVFLQLESLALNSYLLEKE